MADAKEGQVSPTVHGRKRWRWDDGKLHDEPAPSRLPMPLPAALVAKRDLPDPPPAATPAPPAPIPDDFTFTDRTRLRVQAMDFALRAAVVLGSKPKNGAEITAEAEHIERWIVATGGEL